MIKQISCKKTFLFLLFFILFILVVFGVPVLCIIVILKPQMPDFSIQTVNIKSYNLNISSQNLFVSSVFSMDLRAENPNKVGLSYDHSRFHVLSQGLVVGLIRIPQFHQPPLSKNVSIQTRASFECVNVNEILNIKFSKKDDDIRILGDVGAQVRIFNVTLPKIKVALDCGINVSQSKFSVSNLVFKRNHNHLISLLLNSQTFSKKCSLAILL